METQTKLTGGEFFKLYPEESRVELIEGKVYEMPAPSAEHQIVVGRVFFEIAKFLREKGQGEVLVSPVDVVLSEELVLQPDIVFVRDRGKIKKRIYGIPDLVMEVIPPSSLDRDISTKIQKYQQHGVNEYWLVFPQERTILVYTITPKGYRLYSSATGTGIVKSKVLEGFELEVEEVFGGL